MNGRERGATTAAWILASVVAPLAGHAQTSFTGTIEYRTSSARGITDTLVEAKKDSDVSFQLRGPGGEPGQSVGGVIYNAGTGVAYVLFPSNHAYVRLTRDDIHRLAEDIEARVVRHNPEAAQANTLSIVPTGAIRTIAGVRCEVDRVTGAERGRAITDEACIAKNIGLSPYDLPAEGLLAGRLGRTGWLAVVRQSLRGGRGVLELTRDGLGQESIALEAIRIDRHPPADGVFTPPSGYRAVTLREAFGQELLGGAGRGQAGS